MGCCQLLRWRVEGEASGNLGRRGLELDHAETVTTLVKEIYSYFPQTEHRLYEREKVRSLLKASFCSHGRLIYMNLFSRYSPIFAESTSPNTRKKTLDGSF